MRRVISALLALVLVVSLMGTAAFATESNNLGASLNCYMPAMGGCNLAENILKSANYTENSDGTVTITLNFNSVGQWSSAYFSGQTTYVEANGELAYYNGTTWENATYTTGTATDAEGNSYTYVSSMTFTAAEKAATYSLAMYMSGYQFGGSNPSTVSSGAQMTATLTVTWPAEETDDNTGSEDTSDNTGSEDADDNAGSGDTDVDYTAYAGTYSGSNTYQSAGMPIVLDYSYTLTLNTEGTYEFVCTYEAQGNTYDGLSDNGTYTVENNVLTLTVTESNLDSYVGTVITGTVNGDGSISMSRSLSASMGSSTAGAAQEITLTVGGNTETDTDTDTETSGKYTDGTYTATGWCMDDGTFEYELTVNVTVENGLISAITAEKGEDKSDNPDHNDVYIKHAVEGRTRAGVTYIGIPKQIIDSQSVDGIDAVSGATYTSDSIVELTAEALGVTVNNESEDKDEANDEQEETGALATGKYAVDISWSPMASMFAPVLEISAKDMTFSLYNETDPTTSKGAGTVSYADGVYTLTFENGNTTTFTCEGDVITFTSKLFYGSASFNQEDDNGNFVSYTATRISDADADSSKLGIVEGALVCYMPAMGGCNLSENIVKSINYLENEDGTVTITLNFNASGEWSSAYFTGETAYVQELGEISYYNGSEWINADYTTGTATDEEGVTYTYVKSMTFTGEKTDAYKLGMCMSGYQFGGSAPDTVSSGAEMTCDLTIDWTTAVEGGASGSDDSGNSGSTGNSGNNDNSNDSDDSDDSNSSSGNSGNTGNTGSTGSGSSNTSTLISVTSLDDLEAGTYKLTASLSCWLPAMGGCEFGSALSYATLTVEENGDAYITLYFYGDKQITMMYGTTTAAVSPSGEVSYWNGSAWVNASYKTGTATDSEGNSYTYVSSMTFPITSVESTYKLGLGFGGGSMSAQFGGASAQIISTGETLEAILTIDWSKTYTNASAAGAAGASGSSATGSGAGVSTGDTTNIAPIVAVMALAACGLVTLVVLKKRKAS